MTHLTGLTEGSVLQRLGKNGANVTLSGSAAQDAPVTVTISKGSTPLKGWKDRAVGQAKGGEFTVKLTGIPAGGPYALVLRSGKTVAKVTQFYVGDLWIMAGQSNMEGCGALSNPAEPHPLVRCFSMRREWRLATDPLHLIPESPDRSHTPQICTPEEGERLRKTNLQGVGAGIFFGREMLKRTGVPQGLIATAHGGTSMQQWNPELKDKGGDSLYGSMLLSVRAVGQPVSGVLWYQGESDANPNDVGLYTERMKALVAASRSDLAQPNLPWMIVQISRVYGSDWEKGAPSWNKIQDEQARLPKQIKNVETVSAIDLELDDLIHIGSAGFPKLGDRLARAADLLVNGNRKEKPSTRLKSVGPLKGAVGGHTLDLRFENVQGDFQSKDTPCGFSVTDETGKDLKSVFKITLHGDTIRLHLFTLPPESGRIVYGHGVTPYANIVDGAGRALLCFTHAPWKASSGNLPFINTWRRTGVISDAPALAKLSLPDVKALGGKIRTYERTTFDGFIDEHPTWDGKSGQAYFSARINLPEDMHLEFLMGYDGPFRLWLDKKPFFQELNSRNPVTPDEGTKAVKLAEGDHEICIAMDINDGKAWGFCLRFRRLGLTEKQYESGDYLRPFYLA